MISIAIDGPAGAGKSTIARELARRFSLVHVDTGAVYRAVALYFLQKGEDPGDAAVVVPQLPNIHVSITFAGDEQHIFLQEKDVTGDIRTSEASMGASVVSAIPEVRTFLLEQQRRQALGHDVIMDGRDIGTVVLPQATVKIYLTATLDARATRRYQELRDKGVDISHADVLADVRRRDHNDASRATAPLRQATDAVLADTSNLSFAQSVEFLADIIQKRIPSRKDTDRT